MFTTLWIFMPLGSLSLTALGPIISTIGNGPIHHSVNFLDWRIKHKLSVANQTLSSTLYCRALEQSLSAWAFMCSWGALRLSHVSFSVCFRSIANSIVAGALKMRCSTPILGTYIGIGDFKWRLLRKCWDLRVIWELCNQQPIRLLVLFFCTEHTEILLVISVHLFCLPICLHVVCSG